MVYKNIFIIVCIIAGMLNYIPVFIFPESLGDFYFNHKVGIYLVSFFVSLIIVLLNRKKSTLFLFIIYCILSCASPFLRELDNKLIISINKDRSIDNFYSPILGYHKTIRKDLSIGFRYNLVGEDYYELIYQPNHNHSVSNFDGDQSFVKAYDKNWWLLMENLD